MIMSYQEDSFKTEGVIKDQCPPPYWTCLS